MKDPSIYFSQVYHSVSKRKVHVLLMKQTIKIRLKRRVPIEVQSMKMKITKLGNYGDNDGLWTRLANRIQVKLESLSNQKWTTKRTIENYCCAYCRRLWKQATTCLQVVLFSVSPPRHDHHIGVHGNFKYLSRWIYVYAYTVWKLPSTSKSSAHIIVWYDGAMKWEQTNLKWTLQKKISYLRLSIEPF